MYTSYIGAKFLEIYNRRESKNYSAEEFFDKVLFPVVFQSERHLMHVSNSPFFQKPSDKDLKGSGLTKSEFQYHRLREKITQVAETGADGSFYVGFYANGPDQTTSGQVTSLFPELTGDELYASWIGNALAVRVEGAQCLLIDSEPVLWHLFEGWQVYRKYMQPVKGMEGRQIETWNGYWLAKGDLSKAPSPPVKGGKLDTYPWLEVVARLLEWHAGEEMPVYIFSLGQTNTTYGFINIRLPQLQRLQDARHALQKSLLSTAEEDAHFWENYTPDLSLRDVCQLGEVGLRGLRPRDFGKMMEEKFTTPKLNDKNATLFLNIETWLIAMLNNKTDLQQLAADLASELLAAEEVKSRKNRSKIADTDAKALFEARGLTSFINALSDFVGNYEKAAAVSKSVVDQTLRIPIDQFPLFKALLRFEYIYAKNR